MKRVCTAWGRRSADMLYHTQNRSIQTACTVYHTSLPQAISSAISEASAPHHGFISSDMPSHALMLVSRHYFPGSSADQLARDIHESITKALDDTTIHTIAAVVDELGADNLGERGISLLLASEDENASVHVFEDKVDRNISLGRAWKSQGQSRNQETIDDTWVPSGNWKDLLSGNSTAPSEVQHIQNFRDRTSVIIVGKGDFNAIDWPARMFPEAEKYGLTAATTPFLTGLPTTLCHNGRVLESGGIALAFPKRFQSTKIDHARLKRLGEPLKVTKAQGNILITLDTQPATYALLERIRTVIQKDLKISKDILLFGQIDHSGDEVCKNAKRPTIKIIAGDPGKGSIALSGGYRVKEGDGLQLFYEDPETSVPVPEKAANQAESSRITALFTSVGADSAQSYSASYPAHDEMTSPEGPRIVEGLFTASSSSGLVVGTEGRTWVDESVGSSILLST